MNPRARKSRTVAEVSVEAAAEGGDSKISAGPVACSAAAAAGEERSVTSHSAPSAAPDATVVPGSSGSAPAAQIGRVGLASKPSQRSAEVPLSCVRSTASCGNSNETRGAAGPSVASHITHRLSQSSDDRWSAPPASKDVAPPPLRSWGLRGAVPTALTTSSGGQVTAHAERPPADVGGGGQQKMARRVAHETVVGSARASPASDCRSTSGGRFGADMLASTLSYLSGTGASVERPAEARKTLAASRGVRSDAGDSATRSSSSMPTLSSCTARCGTPTEAEAAI